MSNENQKNERVSVEELAALQAKRAVTVIDVRSVAEFDAGHVEGALNVPSDQLSAETMELAGATEVVTVCARGGARSHEAAERLRSLGIKARPLSGGAVAWLEAQRQTKQGGST
jgi:rhodanese-related sulfurtransferase